MFGTPAGWTVTGGGTVDAVSENDPQNWQVEIVDFPITPNVDSITLTDDPGNFDDGSGNGACDQTILITAI